MEKENRVRKTWTTSELVDMFTIAHRMYAANPDTTPADINDAIQGRNAAGVRDMLLHGLRAQNCGIVGSYYSDYSDSSPQLIVTKVNRFRNVLFLTGFDIPANHINVTFDEIRPMFGNQWADTTHRHSCKKPMKVNSVVPLILAVPEHDWCTDLTKLKEANVPIDELVRSANFYRGMNNKTPVQKSTIKRFMGCIKKDGTPSKGYPRGPAAWFKDYLATCFCV